MTSSRRALLRLLPVAGVAVSAHVFGQASRKELFEVTPSEDLMREHGLLKRILLIYGEIADRIDAHHDFPPAAVTRSATIIRTFIEQYHEKLEEQHLFPRFRKHNKLVDLVDVLEKQHAAGRRVTESILTLAAAKTAGERTKLRDALRAFVRMYGPHEAREDTVLFPALHEIVTPHEYASLGEDFEKKEHELFGKEGFEGIVPRVAEIEKDLGIYELAQFTPR